MPDERLPEAQKGSLPSGRNDDCLPGQQRQEQGLRNLARRGTCSVLRGYMAEPSPTPSSVSW